jgi:hypothetical protein
VCPHGVIQMDWKPAEGDALIGKWADEPAAKAAPPKRHWWDALIGDPV